MKKEQCQKRETPVLRWGRTGVPCGGLVGLHGVPGRELGVGALSALHIGRFHGLNRTHWMPTGIAGSIGGDLDRRGGHEKKTPKVVSRTPRG